MWRLGECLCWENCLLGWVQGLAVTVVLCVGRVRVAMQDVEFEKVWQQCGRQQAGRSCKQLRVATAARLAVRRPQQKAPGDCAELQR